MAEFLLDCDESSGFLCEESSDLYFDDLDGVGGGEKGGSNDGDPIEKPGFPDPGFIRVPVWSDETFAQMLERESVYMPKDDYFRRLRSGELDLSFRRDAFDWISKAHTHYCFGPLSFCLSMNYLDRFLSLSNLPRGKAWAVQLLAVACLSIAVKMEETNVPCSTELQVGDPKFVFEAKTVERMELLVLITLNWQMSAVTPCSFLDYFLDKLTEGDPIPPKLINKSMQVILCTIRGLHFLEFKPSEIAAAVAVFVAGETHSVSIDKAISHVQKGRVMNCVELIKALSLVNKGRSCFPESPSGVLETECFSNTTTRSNDNSVTVVGSCPNSSHNTKRMRLDHTISHPISGDDSYKS